MTKECEDVLRECDNVLKSSNYTLVFNAILISVAIGIIVVAILKLAF